MKPIGLFAISLLMLPGGDGHLKTSHKVTSPATQLGSEAIFNAGEIAATSTFFSPAALFTKTDAEKIMGETAFLEDSATSVVNGVLQFKSTHTASADDPKSGKRGNVYFMFERYMQASGAHDVYSTFKTGNQSSEGFRELDGMGDEAYFHSDGTNFLFIIVRKGQNMFRIKVNKITSTTSLDEFNRVAKNITARL